VEKGNTTLPEEATLLSFITTHIFRLFTLHVVQEHDFQDLFCILNIVPQYF